MPPTRYVDHPPRRYTALISARVSPEQRDALDRIARQRGTNLCVELRRAVELLADLEGRRGEVLR